MTGALDTCRADVWLWRARFFKSRSMAGDYIAAGRVRLIRATGDVRLDKASRTVRPGDELLFVLGGRVLEIRIAALGDRRGPASEARSLYTTLSDTTESP